MGVGRTQFLSQVLQFGVADERMLLGVGVAEEDPEYEPEDPDSSEHVKDRCPVFGSFDQKSASGVCNYGSWKAEL